MGTDVAIREQRATVQLSADQLRYIANTEFVPKSMRGKMPAILACVAMGRELGLGDMVALNTIHVIDGRTSLSAEAMVSLVRQRGHSIQGNFSGDSCTVEGKRADNGDEMTVTWTKEMAQDAGLLGKDNYKKYRPAMLWARAVSQLCRMLFSDCFAGSTHTPEEIAVGEWADDDLDSVGEPQAELATGTVNGEPEHSRPASTQPLGADSASSPADTPAPSAAQLKKLNVLVGQLRDAGRITNEQLWKSLRPEQTELWPGDWPRDEAGVLHWSPLRDLLSKDEASALIERLQKYADASVRDSEPVAN